MVGCQERVVLQTQAQVVSSWLQARVRLDRCQKKNGAAGMRASDVRRGGVVRRQRFCSIPGTNVFPVQEARPRGERGCSPGTPRRRVAWPTIARLDCRIGPIGGLTRKRTGAA